MFPKCWRAATLLLLLCSVAVAQRGAVTRQESLSSLTAQAHTIVEGRITESRVEPHPQYPNLTTVVVTLKVAQTLKGQAAPSFTFRQFIWDVRDRLDHVGYEAGSEVLLFLTPQSSAGLRSPVGLEQGHFRITADTKGNRIATNGRNNLGLMPGASAPQSRSKSKPKSSAPPTQGPLLEKDLVRQIKSLVAAQ